MRIAFSAFVVLTSFVFVFLQAGFAEDKKSAVYDSPDAAKVDPRYELQGEYVGTNLGLQVIAIGEEDLELVLYQGGLPGSGWDKAAPQRTQGDADLLKDVIDSKGLKRIERQSPTLNAKPPTDAVVLFDGTKESLDKHWEKGARVSPDGLLVQGATSRDLFRDYTIHLEFRTPFQPLATGQGRGNSGLYHQGRYETQILDSFGLEGKSNETGGIYEVRSPDLNACLPPLTWQTYDIEFTAARYDTSGKKTQDASITVKLNGYLVQSNVPVPAPTRAAPNKEADSPGPIYLQDHGNPVRYRNIWVVPRDAEKEARRPIVPGAERFSDSENVRGQILIAQLGCTSCHASEVQSIAPKKAPVLDNVGSRVRIDYLVELVANPHKTEAGTTMPDLFHGLTSEERRLRSEKIVSFLSGTGKTMDRPGDTASIKRGEELYHSIGCVACHAPRNADAKSFESTSVPLGDLSQKYTLDSLANFLLNPHSVRKSGFMPKIVSDLKEARDVACYLIGKSIIAPAGEKYAVSIYHGTWDKLPDFSKMEPVRKSKADDLDPKVARRGNEFGIVFETYLPIATKGKYKFRIGSDDGSRLLIDGKEVVKMDGVHPMEFREATKELEAGVYPLSVEYFDKSGQKELSVEMEGPDFGLTPISLLVSADKAVSQSVELIPSKFKAVAGLADEGRALFQKTGCANCHSLKFENEVVGKTLKARSISQLKLTGGCLSSSVPSGLPDYELTSSQRSAIVSALQNLRNPLSEKEELHRQMASLNCYACHIRDSFGGPEISRDRFFTTKVLEMGNEGRLPPTLTGVGDKLRETVLEKIVETGAKDRSYVVTRMPGFGADHANLLTKHFVSVDLKKSRSQPLETIDSDPGKQMIASGRKLAGSDGLACIKCHTFGAKAPPGLQAIDMAKMTERLREDWFHRYLLAPTEYRPGTRMPTSFPEGKSVLTSIYDGNADRQIDALWLYLSQGQKAKLPMGVDAEAIVLKPDDKPVIYRNFIEGLSPRGIAVGYPEKVNIAWDANNFNLALLWRNDFIDASKHWVGRGPGFQSPLGDDVIRFENSPSVAIVDSFNAAWPKDKAKKRGYRFRGYSLNNIGQPTFQYALEGVAMEDSIVPVATPADAIGVDRTISGVLAGEVQGLVLRSAAGSLVEKSDGWYEVNSSYLVRIEGAPAKLIDSNGIQELRVQLPQTGSFKIIESIRWK